MKKRFNVVWTRQARDDLRAIRDFIAREAPLAAVTFTNNLRSASDRLRSFPESGRAVSELSDPTVREMLHGNYRIIYRFNENTSTILTVFHSARNLEDTSL